MARIKRLAMPLALIGFCAGIGALGAESAIQTALAAEDSAQLTARVAVLEADLVRSREEIAALRQKNGQLILEIGRLKQVCRKAGIEPDAPPAPLPAQGQMDWKKMDPEVRAFLARYNTPGRYGWTDRSFGGKPAVGEIGELSSTWVLQVIDKQNMLVRAYVADRTRDKGYARYIFWITGRSTEGVIDGTTLPNKVVYKVIGTRLYETPEGATNTVFELKPFDLEAYLKKLQAKE